MKLRGLSIVVFVFSRLGGTRRSRRECRTVSATAKKPAFWASFPFLKRNKTGLATVFLRAAPLCCSPRSFQLTVQTPSSLQHPA